MIAPTTNDKARGQAGRGVKPETTEAHPNAASAQRQRLLQALRQGPITTIAARRDLDVISPAPRILELRRQGHNILTFWAWEDSGVRPHRVARYALLNEVQHGS